MPESSDFKTTLVTVLNQLGSTDMPHGPEVLLLGQSADGKLWSRRIRRRYWLFEDWLVSDFIRRKAIARMAIVVADDKPGGYRTVLLDRADPLDAGAGQGKRMARLSAAARRLWSET